MSLSASQQTALASVAEYARARRETAIELRDHVCRMCDIAPLELSDVLAAIENDARVVLHFHPDRPCGGETVARRLLREGRYRSQYETGISNGGLSAHPGGHRDGCEQRLFGGAYHSAGIGAAERPKYGALELLRHAEGPAPRFGSCYFVLSREVTRRSTFTHLDSHEDPTERGTIEEFDSVFAAVLRDAFARESVFGVADLTAPAFVRRVRREVRLPLGVHAVTTAVRNLNYYVEAQVHGDVDLAADAELLVADPSFHGTETGDALLELCRTYDVKTCWHHGYHLTPAEVPRDFRGPTMPSLAERVARSGLVDACSIGAAVRSLHEDPGAWSARGSFDGVLQELKLLWHVLVRYGREIGTPSSGQGGKMVDILLRRAARLVVFDAASRVLLFQYRDHRGPWWATPGGGAEQGEDLEAAGIREAREELGASDVVLGPLWETTVEYESRGRQIRQLERFFLVTGGVQPDVVQQQVAEHDREGIRALRWWTLDELAHTDERVFPEDLHSRLGDLQRDLGGRS